MNERHDNPKSAPEAGTADREPYLPPRVRVVEVTTQEALMGICKSGFGSGPFGGGCSGVNGPCMGGGS